MRLNFQIVLIILTILFFQALQPAIFTPVYEPDVHYFTRGALNWDVQHPPLYNLFLSVCLKVWPSIYLPIGLQIVFYALSAGLLINRLFRDFSGWVIALGALFAGLEPVITFYNLSLLSESLFVSFSLLCLYFLLDKHFLWAGAALALAFLTRFVAVFYLPVVALYLLIEYRGWQSLARRGVRFYLPFALSGLIIFVGHSLINHAGLFNNWGRTKWDNCSYLYQPEYCADTTLRRFIDTERANSQTDWSDYYQRYEAGFRIIQNYSSYIEKNRLDTAYSSFKMTDLALEKLSNEIERRHYWRLKADFVSANFKAAFWGNFLEYRYRKPHTALEKSEYDYLDRMMARLYGFRQQRENLNPFWTNETAINLYMRVWWAIVFGLIMVTIVRLRRLSSDEWLLFMSWAVPFAALFFTMIPYKTRFAGIYLILVGFYILKTRLKTKLF